MEEVAGNLAVKTCLNADQMNKWLEDHGDVEVLDFKLSGIGQVLVVYRKEDA
ncbi:hypothetical protein [Halalkalibacter hemicellulosilyticus]|uniref:Uncharacterized protein n=1 Tax=Halalkalibacter hemicellulosilyticusJCM 9152 TaxID=1236971 RepID=W4QKK9_9BACI|nr:hypothetical protein [Halalkalibacter hemicellulosilyticus]GAE32417.1 hypothetical protein JCM9152_3951 [Halalkalibacter hemicellulosilyticusJCM 9152]